MESNSNRITAVLGPTNTGKTHLAVETMLEYESGIIGFPLRLLAREIFDKCVNKVGVEKVAQRLVALVAVGASVADRVRADAGAELAAGALEAGHAGGAGAAA